MWKDEKNNNYDKLTVIERVKNDKYGNARWKCQCECGKETIVLGACLRIGSTKSCGCLKERYTLRRSGRAALKNNYSRYKSGAKERNLDFLLTLEEFEKIITTENCHYCNDLPNNKKYAYHRTRYSKGIETDEFILAHGIDRIDNNKGYIKGNVVCCCKICNSMKSKLSYNDFILQIKKIKDNLKL